MKYILLIAATLLTGIALPAQKKIPLELGTDFTYKTNKNLNELLALERKGKGRKIIIDLFGSSCVVCFRMMPKMQEIQDKYRDSVLVVLLGKEDRDIRKVFDKFKSKMSLNFDPVYDSAFFDTYSIPFLPHYIWLDENGITQATTGTDELNPLNFERFIAGLPLITKSEIAKQKFDDSKLFLVNGNGGPDTGVLFRSVLSRWDKTQSTSYPKHLQYSAKGNFFQALSVTVADLYKYAFLDWAWWGTRDTVYGKIYPVPVGFGKETLADKSPRYSYSFSTSLPDSGNTLLRRALRNDLATYFGYEAIVVSRMMPCWKLIALPNAKEKLKSKYIQTKYSESYTSINFQYVSISTVIDLLLSSRQDDYPYIDDTGIDYPIDLSFEAVLYDRESVVNALRNIGLDLVLSEKPMQVLLLQKR